MTRRIGLLGGTFDPIHLTHLHMAEVAREECALDEVWFLPAKQPPHKAPASVTPGEVRLEMLKLAIGSIPYFKLCQVEFEQPGPSYTVETMKRLRQLYPQHRFFFIIGGDMIRSLPSWHRIDELLKLVRFIGIHRPGVRALPGEEWQPYIEVVEMIPSHISSSLIRKRRRQGKSIRFLVPEPVYQYIEQHGLYQESDSPAGKRGDKPGRKGG